MSVQIRRREFITLLGGAAAVRPLAARAQQPDRLRRIGLLMFAFSNVEAARFLLAEIRQGLREFGWVEGQNISIEYRFADGKEDLIAELAAELVRQRLEVIVTEGLPAVQAAKNATQTIPIVMATGGDPVRSGVVASLNRPGGNITGLTLLTADLAGKRLQLLTEIAPGLARVAALWNPTNPGTVMALDETQSAGLSLNVEIHPVAVRSPDELDRAFAAIKLAHPGALIVMADGMFFSQRARIVAFAAASRFPALFAEKEVAQAGGLISYGPNVPANFRRAAAFVDKILRGTKPADLPVEQPAKFELVINLKTAKGLGLTIPPGVLAIADEVIE